jgi:hypothetical protein
MMACRWVGPIVAAAAILAVPAAVVRAQDLNQSLNDYPTSTRAEYVFGCIKANGETRQAIEQCSCSIDVIASIIPYDKYVEAETVASMSQAVGQIGAMFRGTNEAKGILTDLRRAQAEAEIRCF